MAGASRGALIGVLLVLVTSACAGFLVREDPVFARWKGRAIELRELGFVEPVGFRWIERSELREIVRQELLSTYTPEFLQRYTDAYAAMGLLPRDFDLLERQLDMLGEQLVGLYSPYKRTMYAVEAADQGEDQASMIVIHELIHALQHQNFPELMSLARTLSHQDDVLAAVASVLEGDASLTMLGTDPNGNFRRGLRDAQQFQTQMLLKMSHPVGALAEVPAVMRVAQIFPYAYGTPVAAKAYVQEGNAGLDALLQTPPLATRVVQFPDWKHPVEFVGLPLEALAKASAAEGCVVGHHNVAGSMTVRVLLDQYDPNGEARVIPEWMGDRFVQLTCDQGWELVWLTRWTSPTAAEQFAARYRKIATQVASAAQLSGEPQVLLSGKTALVLTPGMREHASLLLRNSDVRAYGSFTDWLDDECFPESPCPWR